MAVGFEMKTAPFAIYFHGRQLFAYYDHYLMSFDLNHAELCANSDRWMVETITPDNVDECKNESFALGRMKRYVLEESNSVEGFMFRDVKTGVMAGFLWIMYPSENEFQYRVRRIDAFIFDVYVAPDFRGQGLCGQMLQFVFGYLRKSAKQAAALGVRTDNKSAIRAYQKAGGEIQSRKRFIQLVHKYNFPYYSV